MNASVAAYAPKGKTNSLTNSSDTHVAIAASVMNLGYASFWNRVFSEFNLEMNGSLFHSLEQRDKKKGWANTILATKERRAKRSKLRYEKYSEVYTYFLNQHKSGLAYSIGIALAMAKKEAMNSPSIVDMTPPGTPREKCRCKYYHPK